MSKYSVTTEFVKKINITKDAFELRDTLAKYFPDAFINWDAHAFLVGDMLEKKNNRGEKQKYMVVKTGDNRAGLLNLKNATLWKNFSTVSVGAFNSISIYAFAQISNGAKPSQFKKIKKP